MLCSKAKVIMRKGWRTRLTRLALLVGALLLVVFLIRLIFPYASRPEVARPVALSSPTPTSIKGLQLQSVVHGALSDTEGVYGIVVKHLITGEEYRYQDARLFDAASLYKLWVMAEAYEQIEQGTLSKDEVISRDVVYLNELFKIASESAERTEGGVTFSVSDALSQMITVSDNYAALVLSERVRLANVRVFLEEHDMTQSLITQGLPRTSASDVALFYEKLLAGELGNQQSTGEMLSFLENQKLNQKLPKYLPEHVVVAHKTGELDRVTHDAGAVTLPSGQYIIVILSESDHPDIAADQIARISEAVYYYFAQ